jgi:hypothetical protein
MKTSHDFNNISPELRKQFTLKRDEVKIFEILGISTDAEGKKLIPNMVSIPTRDTVYDSFLEEYVDIANLKTGYPNADGSYNFDKIWFTRRSNGMIALSGKSAKDRELYMYLAMSNHNESNDDRDPQARAFFRERSLEAEAKTEIEQAMEKQEIMSWLFKATDSQVKLLSRELGLSGYKTVAEIKVALMELINNNYNAVAPAITKVEKVGDMPELLDKALEAKVIKYDGRKHAWTYASEKGGTIKAGVRGANKADQNIAFAEWLNSEEATKAVATIKELIK